MFSKIESGEFLMILNYYNRQTIYFTFIELLYSFYNEIKLANETSSLDRFNELNYYINNMEIIIDREVKLYYEKPLTNSDQTFIRIEKISDQTRTEFIKLIKIYNESFMNKEEFYMDQNKGILINKCFWTYRNNNLITDILELIELLEVYKKENPYIFASEKIILKNDKFLRSFESLKTHLNKFKEDEIKFEKMILEWVESKSSSDKMPKYKTTFFSEKEIWWFYFVYNSKSYYQNDIIKNQNCCFSNNIENSFDIEEGYLISNESESTDKIIIFLESKKYLYHEINKERPNHPIYKGFKWDKLEYNPDKLAFSKRQLRYKKYYIEILKKKSKSIKEQIDQIDDLNESIVRKQFISDSIENIEDILNELENMEKFIKEGVLLNEQLFFKLVLFGINVLIFIGQYFWNNHIKPSIEL